MSKMILRNSTTSSIYSLDSKTLIILPSTTNEIINTYGIEVGKVIRLDEPFNIIRTIIDNGDGTQSVNESTVSPFSVYDYISETPEVLIYTTTSEDVIVETTTNNYTIRDEISNEIEVLYYTNDAKVVNPYVSLESNWSPLDLLDGDFEVVTWTDETNTTRNLDVDGMLNPKLIFPIDLMNITGSINNFNILFRNSDGTERFAFTNNNSTLYVWNGVSFEIINSSDIATRGMSVSEINNSDMLKWQFDKLGVVVFLNKESALSMISYDSIIKNKTPKVSDASLYILNTTAKIDIELDGMTIKGVISDADSTRVQYRVILNNAYYYPEMGNFTQLSPSPQSIELSLKSSDIKIDDWNTLRVEFKDYFGTVDFWEVQFIGRYSGLMFRTTDGQYYSTDIGQVLQYLGFGSIVAGQTTLQQTVVLKNQFGFDVNDSVLSINTARIPQGVFVEFSPHQQNSWSSTLAVKDVLTPEEEVMFDVRMRTNINAKPVTGGLFDIIVMAKRNV